MAAIERLKDWIFETLPECFGVDYGGQRTDTIDSVAGHARLDRAVAARDGKLRFTDPRA